jgi:hypothetical protein
MPSRLHESLLVIFRNRPTLAPALLRDSLHAELPRYTDARIECAELTDVQPAEYRADLVVLLLDDKPVCGIVVEVQLSHDEDKRFVWPVYVVNLRARLRCSVCMLVVTADESVARWASKRIDLGGDCCFKPWVLGPSGVPEIQDDEQAAADPELAVLSAMAHGGDGDVAKAARIADVAQSASLQLDAGRARLYVDLVFHSLSEAARRALRNMNPAKYEYQSDFARHYVAVGRGEGRAALVTRQLSIRFGELSQGVKDKLAAAPISTLDAIGERLLTAPTLAEAVGELG